MNSTEPVSAVAATPPVGPDPRAEILALASSSRRGTPARLRELLPVVEQALSAGVRHKDLIDALQRGGISISLRYFHTALYR